MLLPAITLLDLAESGSEGSIDPLGLYAIADRLAVRMIPGVRERQRRPRYLTLICVSAEVCQVFDREDLASDGVSAPWQVFEWYVVEALVRQIQDAKRLRNLPGREKVASAVKQQQCVSAKRYLKAPGIFGFHGIYRALAKTLRIEQSGVLDEPGNTLYEIWRLEQGLNTHMGIGADWLSKLRSAVADGLKAGRTRRSGSWTGWQTIADHLAHDAPGKRERAFLISLLRLQSTGHCPEVFDFLVAETDRRGWSPDERSMERQFHEALRAAASPELHGLLEAIGAYEYFARLLTDAFDACRQELSLAAKPLDVARLARLPAVIQGCAKSRTLFRAAQEALDPLGLADRLEPFAIVTEPSSPTDWITSLVQFHYEVQKLKLPSPKAPWLIDCGATLAVRPQYRLNDFQPKQEEYVHQYRTVPLTLFARDLRLIA